MQERNLNVSENGTRHVQLATELITTSNLLSVVFPVFPDDELDTWHVIYPVFEKPNIRLNGYDISETMYNLALQTTDLHVTQSHCDGEIEDGQYFPPFYTWEVFPPNGSSIIGLGSFLSPCTGNADLGGLGLTVYVPDILEIPNFNELNKMKEFGTLNVDILNWKRPNEGFPINFQKPESVLMDLIKNDPLTSLEVANWFLKGLLTAKEFHQDTIEFVK